MERKYTVLIVDDSPANIDLLKNILQDQYKVKAVLNGMQALSLLQKNSDIDLILLDIMMPDMDGFEVIRQLKNNPNTANIPIIFVTAKGEMIDQSHGFSLGASDYIIKPVNPPVVLARVAVHIALNEQRKLLEERIAEEVEKRLEKDRMLLHHSRLAAMGEMMSAITHQWNQPLNVIALVGSNIRLSIMLDELNKTDLLTQMDEITSSVEFMSQTMNDFQNYLKPNKHKVTFKLHKEITEIVTMLKPLLDAHGISVKIIVDDNLLVNGVPSEFKQVLLNLLSNAKDAIWERLKVKHEITKGRIIISGHFDQGMIKLNVSDNGGGIPDDIIGYIFSDYFTTKKETGTGIGLTMSKMIIEDTFKGNLSVQNLNDGACFIVELPKVENKKQPI